MSAPEILIGCGPYDRMQALKNGAVAMSGYDLTVREMDVTAIPHAAHETGELDVAEISLGEYISKLEAGDRRYTAVPVFPSMAFRHDCLYVPRDSALKSPAELAGARIGVTVPFGTTVTWVRHWMRAQFGVEAASVDWVVGKLSQPTGTIRLPAAGRLTFEACKPGESLVSKLAEGGIDAIISYTEPPMPGAGLRRLPDGSMDLAAAYYRKFNAIPLLHVFVYRTALTERDESFPRRLSEALTRSKDVALDNLRRTACYTASLPFLSAHIRQSVELLGPDFWPCGLDRHRAGLDIFCAQSARDGHVGRTYTIADMFPDFTGR